MLFLVGLLLVILVIFLLIWHQASKTAGLIQQQLIINQLIKQELQEIRHVLNMKVVNPDDKSR